MKDILGYGGLYQISKDGEIWSVPRSNSQGRKDGGFFLKQDVGKNGYRRVTLFKGGKKKRFLVHRLVLLTFKGVCPEGKEGCHIDGNKANNHVENLRWGTKSQNNSEDRNQHFSYSSRFPGVRVTKNGKYEARIQKNRKQIQIGTFSNEEEAHENT